MNDEKEKTEDVSDRRCLDVTVCCQACYNSHIWVPDTLTREEAIEYAKEHIREIPMETELDYIADSDVLDEENCDFNENIR